MKHRIVILSTADFDSPVWTNKQHLAVGLAENHEVVYVESLGLRAPTFSRIDLTRILKKLARRTSRRAEIGEGVSKPVPIGLQVISPVVIPFHKYGLARALNKLLLKRQIAKIVDDQNAWTLWTFSPLTYGLEDLFDQVVYHSVDLLHTLPKIPADVLLTAEKHLVGAVDYAIASSSGVETHLNSIGFSDALLWENVAHVDLFTAATGGERKNQAVFAGNLTTSKIELDCFKTLLDHGMNLVIAGPVEIDGSGRSHAISDILQHPQVTFYGNLDISDLAGLLAESKVGLIPYQINEYTRGVFPMKVFEYLAAGLSVVSTPLPSLSATSIENLHIVEPDLFGEAVRELMERHDDATAMAGILVSKEHSWAARIRDASTLLSNGLDGQDV